MVVKVSRNILAYWQKASLQLQYGKVVRQFLTEEERWKMGGASEQLFEADYDAGKGRWTLRHVVAPAEESSGGAGNVP